MATRTLNHADAHAVAGGAHHGEEHHPGLAHHFDNMEQQRDSGTLGMWVFLVTEIMFFGGMFLAYMIFRLKFPNEFAAGSYQLDVLLGGINTAVLIGSSLTMALAVFFAQTGNKRLLVLFLSLTILLGFAFLGIKAVEYGTKISHNTVPGANFHVESDKMASFERKHPNESVDQRRLQMFFVIYYMMTGIHALHMIIGIGIMAVLAFFAMRNRYSPEYHSHIELAGLYWHFVDVVWIFLFPLLYLIGRQ
ncbi:MAG: cytochrome c oxidase subunit 3 family protein [Pyrinomonadaceae bacterium]